MVKAIFVNLAVKDLKRSKEFFEKLGFHVNPQFTDATAASLVLGENLYAMLLTEEKFRQFTKKEIVDAHSATEVLTALSVESKAAVDAMVDAAVAAGGKVFRDVEDYGFMYGRSFEDLDGHIWEIFWMDPAHIK